ncbi:hypothetical protein SFC79_02575 [Nocardioides sp. S-58]|uniref:Uncharacterized protein n=1 Tax=Nocardioides renjunii TaxID=3095075 RepID=A0ABU5K6Y2_9ACTN|nr:hypothetical protein [Nocardioides sp. S-58]MDZ5660637.1 hypothetical protein [Nocardioides sp. S-58]
MLDALGFTGSVRVTPPLNPAETGFLRALTDSGRTLRSTPTGRGNDAVPFARLAWVACLRGCCLEWDGSEATRWMAPSLEFLVEHLLAPGALGEGRPRFEDFTFDHVLDGAVVGRSYDDAEPWLVQVTGNRTSGRTLRTPCGEDADEDDADASPSAMPTLAANVIAFRPRRA